MFSGRLDGAFPWNMILLDLRAARERGDDFTDAQSWLNML